MPLVPGIDPGLQDVEGQVEALGQVADDRIARNDRGKGEGDDATVVFHECMDVRNF
jgi:hypothetical protein